MNPRIETENEPSEESITLLPLITVDDIELVKAKCKIHDFTLCVEVFDAYGERHACIACIHELLSKFEQSKRQPKEEQKKKRGKDTYAS